MRQHTAGGRAVAHLLSIMFFFGLLIGLFMLLERTVRDSGGAMLAAWRGTLPAARAGERASALGRWGTCLRASFAADSRDGFGDDMRRLLLQLSPEPRAGSRR